MPEYYNTVFALMQVFFDTFFVIFNKGKLKKIVPTNYFFNYHRKFNCAILNLLKVNQFQFVQISADTRHWYSHFLAPTQRVNRLKTGEEMLIWFDILQYAIRLMLISELYISVDSNIIQEYYYILHDWILNVKHNKADNVKSNAYKISPLS